MIATLAFLIFGSFIVKRAYSGVVNTDKEDELHEMHVKNFENTLMTYFFVATIIFILGLFDVIM